MLNDIKTLQFHRANSPTINMFYVIVQQKSKEDGLTEMLSTSVTL